MFIFKTKINYNSDTIVQILDYEKEFVSYIVDKAHLNDMKHNAYYNATL